MQNMRAFKTVCPLRNELHLDITTAVKVTTTEVFPSAEQCFQIVFSNEASMTHVLCQLQSAVMCRVAAAGVNVNVKEET